MAGSAMGMVGGVHNDTPEAGDLFHWLTEL
jgi:hypothetical protein